ncbi:MAG: hypothetical protein CM15mP96_2360 [Gammaproteobacteria bacterium]|nr:MAG: hypothetical protein CM15mP96_2360 [Gammaproteobacteria bacterium]
MLSYDIKSDLIIQVVFLNLKYYDISIIIQDNIDDF